MTANKSRFSMSVDAELYEKIEEFRYANRLKSQNQTILKLLEQGFDRLAETGGMIVPKETEEKVTKEDRELLKMYHTLDRHGKELVHMLLSKEYERCFFRKQRKRKEPEDD
ncbi:MAG: hypothetical protein IKI88_07340 [Anaerotignum sp.]|nr:hypothetical protein [Anaerotignum sp.]